MAGNLGIPWAVSGQISHLAERSMANIETRLGILARRIQGVIAIATRPEPPITRLEAYDQIVEEMELAGFGAPVHGGDLSADELAELRRQAAN